MAPRRAEAANSPSADKLPPQSVENERTVLGAMLIEAGAVNEVVELLHENDFYGDVHRKIYRAILTLYDTRQPVDSLTVTEQLRRQGDLEDVGGAAYVTELSREVPTAANAQAYAKIVREKAVMRALITSCTDVVRRAFDETEDPDKLSRKARRAVAKTEGALDTTGFLKVADKFIDVANRQNAQVRATDLQMAFLYAAARYNAFVAKTVLDVDNHEVFVKEMAEQYKEMLRQHLGDPSLREDETSAE